MRILKRLALVLTVSVLLPAFTIPATADDDWSDGVLINSSCETSSN